MSPVNKKINIIFFGTSDFAKIILQRLLITKNLSISAIISQPDKPVGRKKILTSSPVKIIAQQHKLTILQPKKLDDFFYKIIKNINADLFIVAAYGKIIPLNIINLPTYKTINIHPSLLPQYRGPAPIQYALLNGNNQTGISIMLIDEKMDHGSIISNLKFPIHDDDTYITLSKKLAQQSVNLLVETIPKYISGKIKPQPQNHHQATYSKIITKEDGLITADKTAEQIYNMWRAYITWPGIYLPTKTKLINIKPVNLQHHKKSLEIFTDNHNLFMACAHYTTIQIRTIQPPGKKSMDAKSYINGYIK